MLPTTRAEWATTEQREHAVLHEPPNPPYCLARCRSETQVILDNATWLLERLYEPDAEYGYCFRGRALTFLHPNPRALDKEPINWGDLRVVDVIRHGDGWMLTLEEASPGDCPALCEYVRSWLERWGWPAVVVQTEW